MKIFQSIYFYIIILFLICSALKKEANQKEILGVWEYKYSTIDDTTFQVEFDKLCPVQIMKFEICNDENELKKFPEYVKKFRRNNMFQNISCETYNNNHLIDRYYPVSNLKDNEVGVVNYGNRYKHFYTISTLKKDTLIIYNGKYYYLNNNSCSGVKHIYIRKTNTNQ